MPIQYIACKFRPTDEKTYTYRNDSNTPLKPGTTARVPGRDGKGFNLLHVTAVDLERPQFMTRAIIDPDWIDLMTTDEARDFLASGVKQRDPFDEVPADLFGAPVAKADDAPSDEEIARIRSKVDKAG